MDKLLRPKLFETETTDPNSEKLYKHWKVTFKNYLETAVPDPTHAEQDDAATRQAAVEIANKKRYHGLINNISASVYELISEITDYEAAMAALDNAYIRPTSVIYNRHCLITTKQEAGQSIDTYLQQLQRISKTCEFQAVNAEQNRNQYTRDAFINGLSSPNIRQRLLENIGELTLEQATTQARALEQAQNQSASYETSVVAAITPVDNEDSLAGAGNRNKAKYYDGNSKNFSNNKTNFQGSNSKNENHHHQQQQQQQQQPQQHQQRLGRCFWCTNTPHKRSVCPAHDNFCLTCNTKGHWAEVYQKSQSLGAIGPIAPPNPNPGPALA